jgi:hypothetical protein
MNEQASTTSASHPIRDCLLLLVKVAAIPICLVAGFRLSHDFSNIPLCNKAIFFAVYRWFDTHTPSANLPNENGKSDESLQELMEADHPDEWVEQYQYISGLRRGDPGDLVLAYRKSPTRWRHHAAGPPLILSERKWILIPFDFTGVMESSIASRVKREMPDVGEDAERVSREELNSRLQRTLKYLQDNNRPNWEIVAAENKEFLNSNEKK